MLIGLALGFEVPHVQISYYTFLNSDMLNPVYSFLFSLSRCMMYSSEN